MTVSTVTTPCGFITSFFLLFSFTTVLVRDSVVVWTYSAPNPLFLCGRVKSALEGAVVWRLALSDAAWTPIVFGYPAIAEPESVGQVCGS